MSLQNLTPAAILLPWSQLTHFTGKDFKGVDCLHVLQRAVSLIECKFSIVTDNQDKTLLPPHHGLEVLQVDGHMGCADILGILTLPSLLKLDYDDENNYRDDRDVFVSFLSRSRPPLQRLFMSAYKLFAHGVPFLHCLVDLKITGLSPADMSGFVHNLWIRDAASFLPNLQSIVVSALDRSYYGPGVYDGDATVDYGHLVDALNLRGSITKSGPRLQSFELTWKCHAFFEDTERTKLLLTPPPEFSVSKQGFLDLIQEGMHISAVAKAEDIVEVWI